MLRYLLLFGLAIVACPSAVARGEGGTAESAEAFIDGWAASFVSFDPQRTTALYDRSEETEVIVSAGDRFRGYEAIRAMYQDAQKEVRFLSSAATNVDARAFGETAIVSFEHTYQTQLRADQSRWKGHVRTTAVLRRAGDRWVIVLEHSSPIRGIDRITRLSD